jgi:hypothetical protein
VLRDGWSVDKDLLQVAVPIVMILEMDLKL